MNLVSFLDELVKLGGAHCVVKRANLATSNDIPQGMVDDSPVPEHIEVRPADATTRLPLTGGQLSQVQVGALGDVTEAREPIDRDKFNRTYKERR
jgi:hypothetical protein